MDKKLPPVIIGVLRTGAAAFVLLCSLVLPAQNPKIKCYFNRPVNTGVSTGVNAVYLNTTFVDTTVAYINRSKYTLDICVYNYTYFSGDGLDAIATAVNNAYNRGVVVRWIHDGSATNSGLALLNSNILTVASPTTSAYGLMHHKFMAIDANSGNPDDAIVFTGSFNFSRAQSDVDYNNIIIFQDQPLAQAYYAEFNQMWGSTSVTPNLSNSKFGPYKSTSAQTSFTVNGTPVEVYFSPNDNTQQRLKNTINSVNNDLFFGIYTFTDTSIANLFKNKNSAGYSVRGIMDSYSQSFTPYTTLSTALGSSLRVYSGTGTYHNKTLLVDAGLVGSDAQVFTGSYNWTISAQTKNDENTVVVHDESIVNQYYQSFCRNFTDMGGAACATVGVEDFDNGDAQVAVFPNPSEGSFTVKVKNSTGKLEVRLANMMGQVLVRENSEGSDQLSIEPGDLAAGLYLLHIDRGDQIFTRKIMLR